MTRLLRFAAALDRLAGWTGALVCVMMLAMVFLGAGNAALRTLNRAVGIGITSNLLMDAQWQLFSLVFLLGASWALRDDAHVRVDVLYSRLAPRTRVWINLAGTVLFLLPFCVVMLWASWPFVETSWRVWEGSPDPGGLPRWAIKTAIPLGFTLLFVQGIAILIRCVAALRGFEVDEAGSVGEEQPRDTEGHPRLSASDLRPPDHPTSDLPPL